MLLKTWGCPEYQISKDMRVLIKGLTYWKHNPHIASLTISPPFGSAIQYHREFASYWYCSLNFETYLSVESSPRSSMDATVTGEWNVTASHSPTVSVAGLQEAVGTTKTEQQMLVQECRRKKNCNRKLTGYKLWKKILDKLFFQFFFFFSKWSQNL